jgi:antitoxin component of MazEF toxin-antitoxin module
MRRKIVRIGNSLGVTLPRASIAILGLAEGDAVDVEVSGRQIVIGARGDVASMLAAWKPIGRKVPAADLVLLIRDDRDSR